APHLQSRCHLTQLMVVAEPLRSDYRELVAYLGTRNPDPAHWPPRNRAGEGASGLNIYCIYAVELWPESLLDSRHRKDRRTSGSSSQEERCARTRIALTT